MKFLLVAVLAGLFGVMAQAQEPALKTSKPAIRKEVVATIEGQLAAFRESDVARAYAYAALGLQARTPLPRFAQMVRQGYPEIWTNTRAEFGLVRDDGEHATTTARIFAKDGTSASYDYILLKEEDVWHIAGVLRHEPRGETKT